MCGWTEKEKKTLNVVKVHKILYDRKKKLVSADISENWNQILDPPPGEAVGSQPLGGQWCFYGQNAPLPNADAAPVGWSQKSQADL